MLIEVKQVKQLKDEGYRRWFMDTYFDLIVWYDNYGKIKGFQLCYDKDNMERSLTWNQKGGYQHNKIDGGEHPGHAKMTPILISDGLFSKNEIAARFKKASEKIDKNIASFVYEKILTYQ